MAKGGGAWKVAYADFVTAMMAFFLVMWLVGQDTKVREAIANYFTDPVGASTKPGKTGAVFQGPQGRVPEAESVAMGRGRESYTTRDELSPTTKLVSDWLHSDGQALRYWKEQARRVRTAAVNGENRDESAAERDPAQQLSKQLRDEITRGVPPRTKGLYQDLLFSKLAEVNWTQLAEDLLSN